jgi:hypothetical protein
MCRVRRGPHEIRPEALEGRSDHSIEFVLAHGAFQSTRPYRRLCTDRYVAKIFRVIRVNDVTAKFFAHRYRAPQSLQAYLSASLALDVSGVTCETIRKPSFVVVHTCPQSSQRK